MLAIPLELKKAIAVGIGPFIASSGSTTPAWSSDDGADSVDLRLHDLDGRDHAVRVVLTIVLRARGFRGDLLVGIVPTTAFATLELGRRRLSRGARLRPLAGRPLRHTRTSASSARSASTRSRRSRSSRRSPRLRTDDQRLLRHDGHARRRRAPGRLPRRARGPARDPASRCSSTRLAASAGGSPRRPRRRRTSSRRPVSPSAAAPGWVSVVTGALFFPFMFIAPLIGMVPPQATAPALIIVGYLMMSVLSELEEAADVEEGAPPRSEGRAARRRTADDAGAPARGHRLPGSRARPRRR